MNWNALQNPIILLAVVCSVVASMLAMGWWGALRKDAIENMIKAALAELKTLVMTQLAEFTTNQQAIITELRARDIERRDAMTRAFVILGDHERTISEGSRILQRAVVDVRSDVGELRHEFDEWRQALHEDWVRLNDRVDLLDPDMQKIGKREEQK